MTNIFYQTTHSVYMVINNDPQDPAAVVAISTVPNRKPEMTFHHTTAVSNIDEPIFTVNPSDRETFYMYWNAYHRGMETVKERVEKKLQETKK